MKWDNFAATDHTTRQSAVEDVFIADRSRASFNCKRDLVLVNLGVSFLCAQSQVSLDLHYL